MYDPHISPLALYECFNRNILEKHHKVRPVSATCKVPFFKAIWNRNGDMYACYFLLTSCTPNLCFTAAKRSGKRFTRQTNLTRNWRTPSTKSRLSAGFSTMTKVQSSQQRKGSIINVSAVKSILFGRRGKTGYLSLSHHFLLYPSLNSSQTPRQGD